MNLEPSDLDLPISRFRPAQIEAIDYAVYFAARSFVGLGLPTGTGKTWLAMALAKLLGARKSVYICSTRGLQDQARNYGVRGLQDIRGRANYVCTGCRHSLTGQLIPNLTCDHGHKNECNLARMQSPDCDYYAHVSASKRAPLVSTNYAYWLHARGNNPRALELDGSPFELLLCDEAHSISGELTRYLEVTIPHYEYPRLKSGLWWSRGESGLLIGEQGFEFMEFARKTCMLLRDRLKMYERSDPEYAELHDKLTRYQTIAQCDPKTWVWEEENNSVTFTPVYPGRYAYRLWSRVPRVVLLSATLRPYTMQLLGLNESQYDFREWGGVFSDSLAPVYYWPTRALTRKSSVEDVNAVIDRMDVILEARRDRKAIIHSVSYERSKSILARSRFRSDILFNKNGTETARVIAEFRRRDAPVILLSPSVSTGYDFAGEQCELQIVVKVPFPNEASRVIKERCANGAYRLYATAQEIVQMCGRARRSDIDRCETFILDSKFGYVMSQRQYVPQSFTYKTIKELPLCPPKL